MPKSVRICGAGGPEVLSIVEVGAADLRPDEVRIEVAAAGLNRADCLQRMGVYPAPKGVVADVPGLEFAGRVREVGADVPRWSVGDRVMGICAGGAMSTELCVHHTSLVPMPEGMSFEDAAAIPEVFMTAYDALVQGGLLSSETPEDRNVLIHAVGSGVGTAALQLARRAGERVIGTSRTPEKIARAEALGLTHSIVASEARFASQCREVTEGRGADAIIDFVGAAYLRENLKSLATKGRLVVVGLLGGATGELPLGLLLAKRAQVIGTVLRSRSQEEKAELARTFEAEVLPGFASGELAPIVDRVMPMAEIAKAHRYLESNASFGKVVMTWGDA